MKPGNVLFRADDSAAITDFGIAKAIGSTTLTGIDAVMGTPQYISPEQIDGATADRRSDLYSLGVIFFETLTGEKPFKGTRLTEVLDKHLNGPIPRLPAHLAEYQPVIDGLLAKDPAERFQTTDELLMGLDWR
jgi:serine/threonine-protein kinase PpkA